MAVVFNEAEVAAEPAGKAAERQRLLTPRRTPGTRIALTRITLKPGGDFPVTLAAKSLGWFQMLGGEARLVHDEGLNRLTEVHVGLLPPGFAGTFSSARGAVFLLGEIPDAAAIDASFTDHPPRFRWVDWSREPVLNSEHDARQRIYLVTPKLFGTKAIKGEMIYYPRGTSAAKHHHEGAEHFMYVLRGGGTVFANDAPAPVQVGDVIWYADHERHYLAADSDRDMVFAEFFAPAEFRTIWVDARRACGWLPTGRDIRGNTPARQIKAHSSAEMLSPADV